MATEVHFATIAAPVPGRVNEDIVLAGPDWVIVLDGATPWPGRESGCRHGVAWYVRRLAAALADRLNDGSDDAGGSGLPGLADVLAAALSTVAAEHSVTCDLTNPDSPSATVLLVRWTAEVVDYLVLADSVLLIEASGRVHAVTDDRIDHLPDYTPDGIARLRNQPGGFWAAAARPEVAAEAVVGSVPVAGLRRIGLVTDGAARLVQRFADLDWAGLLRLLADHGPDTLLRATRHAEAADDGNRRGKRYDDATAVLITWAGG